MTYFEDLEIRPMQGAPDVVEHHRHQRSYPSQEQNPGMQIGSTKGRSRLKVFDFVRDRKEVGSDQAQSTF